MSKLTPDQKHALMLSASNDQLAARIREALEGMSDTKLEAFNRAIQIRSGVSALVGDDFGLLIFEMAQLKLSEHLLSQESPDAA